MAYTYSIATDRGKVRFLTGDTNTLDALLQDDEIDYLLTAYITVRRAAVEACRSIAAKLSREADLRIGDLSISKSQKAASYRLLAVTLQTSSNAILSGHAGGISISDEEDAKEDTDRVEPMFKRDMMSSSDQIEVSIV